LKIIILGPPGAGKGTQSKMIAEKENIPHISTGDIFRKAIKEKTPLGEKAEGYLAKGLLVPDEIVIGIVEERLKQPDCNKGFVLDGFPRTIEQAKGLDSFMVEAKIKLDQVVNIYVDPDELIKRFTGRRMCQNCSATFHMCYNPPKVEGTCDKCGAKLIQREDDQIETVKKRLEVYDESTAPLIDFYKEKNILTDVDGSKPIDEVFRDIISRLRGERL